VHPNFVISVVERLGAFEDGLREVGRVNYNNGVLSDGARSMLRIF
jgi:hypothetical protein